MNDADLAQLGSAETPSDAPPVAGAHEHEITLEEALSVAVLMQQQGRIDDAEKICRAVLEGIPDHPDALHFLALAIHRRGAHAEAEAIIEAVLARHPNHADAWSNLGIFRKTAGRIDAAAEAFERAIALDPQHANAWSNLGIVRRAQGRLDEAEAAYQRALAVNPAHAGAWHNLAVLLEGRGQIPDAVIAFSRACVHDPANADSKRLLAHAYCTIGEREKAVEVLRSWLAEQPGHPIATHLLAACSGNDVPSRASDACVEHMFDSFANTFDAKLRRLRYQAPELVVSMLTDSLPPSARSLAIADAGCGTGLCGPLLAPYARTLTGVDLSAGMLERARERAIYDELIKAELTAFFTLRLGTFDVIVSADTLVYFGELRAPLAAMAAALRSGGMLVFTLERTPEAAGGYVLETHGRYAHTEGYVWQVLESLNLVGRVVPVELRMESGRPVDGLLVRAVKPSSM
jgi:predicted TPR repeat methyltransferase